MRTDYTNCMPPVNWEVAASRRKALEMLPELRKRDEGGKIVRVNERTWIIK